MKCEDIKNILFDMLYPNRCPCCNDFIEWNRFLCDNCIEKVNAIKIPDFCHLCGRKPCICTEKPYYDRAYVYKPYLEIIRDGIISLKKGYNMNFAKYCGIELSKLIEKENADMIIPVPMSKRKKRARGYNQAEIIAQQISKAKNIPIEKNILKMKYSKVSQHSKNRTERTDIEKYISIKDVNLEGKKIILCDDIITTSSTVNVCSRLLKEKGAETVVSVLVAGTV